MVRSLFAAGLAALTLSSSQAAPVGVVTEFRVPTANSQPAGIAEGPDGAMWFTEFFANKIGRVTPDGTVTEFPLPAASAPGEIELGPDNNLWFVETGTNKLGRITANGTINEFTLPASPRGVTAGPDGRIWFTEENANRIGAMNTNGTGVQELQLPNGTFPDRIVRGQDNRLWITEFGTNAIAALTAANPVSNGTLSTFNLAAGSQPDGLVEGPDGHVWFTESGTNRIGFKATNGTGNDFPVPSAGGAAKVITAGFDGNLWFTEPAVHKIARITTAGTVTEFSPLTANAGPMYIAGGPGGMIWFSEAANKIGVASSGFDTTAPSVSIASPADGAQFTVGQHVVADYSCSDDAGGSGVADCTGSVARGAALDTSRAGPASLTVTAHDLAGNATTVTHNFTVAPVPTPTPTPTPTAAPTPAPTVPPVATATPTATPVVAGNPKRPKVRANLVWSYKFDRHFTWFTKLRLSKVTKGAKLTVSCKGGGCPKGKVTLARMHAKKLRKGAVLELRFTKRGATGLRIDLVVRKAGQMPLSRQTPL